MTALTVEVLDEFAADERWNGWGYLGERSRAQHETDPECRVDPQLIRRADEAIVSHANALGWDRATLFAWCDAKAGRWFADEAFGQDERGFDTRIQRLLAKYLDAEIAAIRNDIDLEWYA